MATPETKATKATKTPKVVAAPAPAETPKVDKKAAKAEKERVAQNDKFVFRNEISEGAKKLAPQAQCIVNIVEAAGKKGITRAELVKNMEGVVTTRQPLGRILSYYQKQLIETGYFSIEAAAA